jgi:hypothetical protein
MHSNGYHPDSWVFRTSRTQQDRNIGIRLLLFPYGIMMGSSQTKRGKEEKMSQEHHAEGGISPTITIGSDLVVHRIGYGAMQLTGPKVWGEYPDREAGIAFLKAVVASGVTFLDTADT